MSEKLRVWWVPQVPMGAFYVNVANVEEGVKIMGILAEYDNFQYVNNIKVDYSNAGGLEMLCGQSGEWESWYDEETGEDDPVQFIARD